MMNIKNIFITTGISVLFGVYSVYNLLEYLRTLNNYHKKQINILEYQIKETNKKYIDFHNKYFTRLQELQKKYNQLLINYEYINQEVKILNNKISELQENKSNNITIPDTQASSPISNDTNSNNTFTHDIIICDELCDLNNNIPRIHMETMSDNNNIDNIDHEFFESLSLEYNNELSYSQNNSEKYSSKCSSRTTSVKDINWTTLAKKFLFG